MRGFTENENGVSVIQLRGAKFRPNCGRQIKLANGVRLNCQLHKLLFGDACFCLDSHIRVAWALSLDASSSQHESQWNKTVKE
ncbi:hypothetical protein AOLI_G00156690 [Acnodon oligacanthus]